MARIEGLDRQSTAVLPDDHPSYLLNTYFVDDFKRYIASYARGRLLDMGCGNKPYEEMFDSFVTEYVGCDIVQSSLNKVDIICDVLNVPKDDASFDTVVSTQVLEHLSEPQIFINEAFRLLSPGGYLLLSSHGYWPVHEAPFDFFRYTPYGFRHLLTKAGFQKIDYAAQGGKWALCGMVLQQTIYPEVMQNRHIIWKILRKLLKIAGGRRFLNRFFKSMDHRYPDPSTSLNYLFVAQKPE